MRELGLYALGSHQHQSLGGGGGGLEMQIPAAPETKGAAPAGLWVGPDGTEWFCLDCGKATASGRAPGSGKSLPRSHDGAFHVTS